MNAYHRCPVCEGLLCFILFVSQAIRQLSPAQLGSHSDHTNKGSCFAMALKKVMKSKGMLKSGKKSLLNYQLPNKPKKKPAAAKDPMNIDSLTSFFDIVKDEDWAERKARENEPMPSMEWSENEEEAEQEVKDKMKRPGTNVLNVGWIDGWMSYMRPSIKAIFGANPFFVSQNLGFKQARLGKHNCKM